MTCGAGRCAFRPYVAKGGGSEGSGHVQGAQHALDDVDGERGLHRPGSKWGNPFRIGADGDRAAVIAKHERWLRGQHHLLWALDELRGRDLICFCAAPLPWRSPPSARERQPGGADRLVAGGGVSPGAERGRGQPGGA
jgi:hypothetical protein